MGWDELVAEQFDLFWAAWPSGVRGKQGKGAARRAFAKARKRGVEFHRLMDALEQQAQSQAWLEQGGKFIPNPATWLNQERWEDVLGATATRQLHGTVSRSWRPDDDCPHTPKCGSARHCLIQTTILENRMMSHGEA